MKFVRFIFYLATAVGLLLCWERWNSYMSAPGTFRVDTLIIVEHDTIFQDKVVPITFTEYIDHPTVIYVDTAGDSQTTDSLALGMSRAYSDTAYVEPGFIMWYEARVKGSLSSIDLRFKDDRPDKIISKTITVEKNKYLHYPKVRLGVDIDFDRSISPGLMLNRKRWTFKANYNIKTKNISTGVYVGLWSRKP